MPNYKANPHETTTQTPNPPGLHPVPSTKHHASFRLFALCSTLVLPLCLNASTVLDCEQEQNWALVTRDESTRNNRAEPRVDSHSLC
ncbi:hypothetical protein COCC4DRAFT_30015 [Bipolaris maydis ATCC 48331]|uniref:Uncharacterized protein n=2 Tax=Cochliobolus heterostrophus TaxID=5016 RepID=M2SZ90_COCH5|nr:uncharacterized protein COCC4DRAFT_30015 [Bipolaris maydis ATCC 48331]EMD90700.1 hypothetical protein COCHEDRAFT_1022492 [Bipolaris maydis C5]ENI09089.1 hypothetical protein COCC4DRAFT_30015 [Bipolaris maydis ATCC 48331]